MAALKKSPLESFRKECGLSRNELASLAQEDDAKLRTQISQAIARCEAGLENTGHYCLKLLWLKLNDRGLGNLESEQKAWIDRKIAGRKTYAEA